MNERNGLWRKTRGVQLIRLGFHSTILILCFLLAACSYLVPGQKLKIQELEIDFPTQTSVKTDTATPTSSPSPTPSNTNQPTNTPKPSNTATPEPSSTPEASQTPTETLTQTPTATPTETPTETPTATVTPTEEAIGCPNGCTEEKPGCHIKGNISSRNSEKIYHMPYQRFYAQTVINPAYGERWFCTEEEAVANGWRKSKQ